MFKLKKITAIAMAICVIVCGNAQSISAEEYVQPYNIAIGSTNYGFSISASGEAVCFSKVEIIKGYTAQLTMQLQQKAGVWKTIQTWSDSSTYYVVHDEKYQVEKGYDYRLMVVYVAYDSEGKKVESFYDLSDIVEYK